MRCHRRLARGIIGSALTLGLGMATVVRAEGVGEPSTALPTYTQWLEREREILRAERAMLESETKRRRDELAEVQRQHAERLRALEEELVALSVSNEKLERATGRNQGTSAEVERDTAVLTRQTERLGKLLEPIGVTPTSPLTQASKTTGDRDEASPEQSARNTPAEHFDRAATHFLATLERLAAPEPTAARVFDETGQPRSGTVTGVGRVGRWVDGQPAIPTAATPDAPLRWVQTPGPGAWLYVYDPRNPEPPRPVVTVPWYDRWRAGGPVMWPLGLLALLIVAIASERALVFARARRADQRAAPGWTAYRMGQATRPTHREAPLDRILAAVETRHVDPEDPAVVAAILGEKHRLERRINWLAVAAAVAPLLGLLGTVSGLIATFVVLTNSGGRPEAKALAGGISEALVTTEFGLILAIPAVLLHAVMHRALQERVGAWQIAVLAAAHPGVLERPASRDTVRLREADGLG